MSNFAASVVAGLALLYLTYRFVDHRLHLRDRAERESSDRKEREERREAVLTAVLSELCDSAAKVQEWLQVLPKGHIPMPGFNTTGWPLVAQAPIFTTLSSNTVSALTHAYNRMGTTNEHLASLSDLNHGPTAILVNSILAQPAENNELAQSAFDKFYDHRESVRAALIERVTDLKSALDNAIDAVEAEVGQPGPVPAAQRKFQHIDQSLIRQLAEIEQSEPPSRP